MGEAERVVYWWGDWWGSPDAIVRCERPEGMPHDLRQNEKVVKIAKQVIELMPGKPVEFGEPTSLFDHGRQRQMMVRPALLVADGFGIAVPYLAFAERYAKPEGWEVVILRGGGLAVFAGVRSDQQEPVACVAGFRLGDV